VGAHIVSKHPNADWRKQHVSHDGLGISDINAELRHPSNSRFILHDSVGFEPGDDAPFNTVKRLIEERGKMTELKDRPRAIL
jgi:hypothetical protein